MIDFSCGSEFTGGDVLVLLMVMIHLNLVDVLGVVYLDLEIDISWCS